MGIQISLAAWRLQPNGARATDMAEAADNPSTIVVMQATGGYEHCLVQTLHEHGIALAVVNPRRVSDFADGIGRDAKTDPIDAGMIAFYAQVVKPEVQVVRSEE